ncbi:MAG: hypothetical protein ACTSPN_11820 [Promethearchaeota archaeon]
MQNQRLIQRLRDFFNKEYETGKNLITYQRNLDYNNFFGKFDIGVKLDHFKEVILQEETGLELGGVNKKSFLLIFPIQELEILHNGNITLLGQEIKAIKESSIDFGLFILIGVNKSEIDNNEFKQLSFISNSIEGFLIRTIPRRFWCRISSNVLQHNFSFEFLGNAIFHLYHQKFGNLIKAMEIFFINTYKDSIGHFKEISSEIQSQLAKKWKAKIEEWKKMIDCEYDWGCQICPFRDDCYYIKEILIKREELRK